MTEDILPIGDVKVCTRKPPHICAENGPCNGWPKYSFCETIAAYVWHIRPLTDAGKKLGGGADTLTLCGLKAAWDINTPVNVSIPLDGICFKCRQVYRRVNE